MNDSRTRRYDPRYDEYVTCPECGQSFQLLDWGCARHGLSHRTSVPPVPVADQQRIIATAASFGQVITWR